MVHVCLTRVLPLLTLIRSMYRTDEKDTHERGHGCNAVFIERLKDLNGLQDHLRTLAFYKHILRSVYHSSEERSDRIEEL